MCIRSYFHNIYIHLLEMSIRGTKMKTGDAKNAIMTSEDITGQETI